MNNSNHWGPSLQSSTFYQAIAPTHIGQERNKRGLKNKKSPEKTVKARDKHQIRTSRLTHCLM